MALIGIVLLVIFVVSAVLLVLLVLIQDEQGEGIGGLFAGGSSTPFGSRSGNVLTRFTAVIATVFLACAFAIAWINRNPEAGNVIGTAREESLKKGESADWWVETKQPPQQTPAQQAPAQQTPAQQTPATGAKTVPNLPKAN